MNIRSRRWVAVGVTVALIVPILSWILARLILADIVSAATAGPGLNLFGTLAWAALFVLAPVGLAIAGWAGGVRGFLAWIAYLIVAVPAYVMIWFVGVAELSGALGSPF